MAGYYHICPDICTSNLPGHAGILWGQKTDSFGDFGGAIFYNSSDQLTLSGAPLLCGGDITLDGNNISLSGNNTTLYSTCSSDLFTINFYNPGDVGIGTTGPGNFSVLHLRYNDKVSCSTELSTVEMALTGDLCVTGSVWSDSVVNVYGNQSICCNLSIVGIGGTGDPAEGCCAVFNLKSDCANSEIQLCTGSTNCFSKPLIEFNRSRDECYANDILTTTCSGDVLGEIAFKGVDMWQGYSQSDLYQHSLGVCIQAVQTDIPCYAIGHVPAKLNITIPDVVGGQITNNEFSFENIDGEATFVSNNLSATSLTINSISTIGMSGFDYNTLINTPVQSGNLGCTNEVAVVSGLGSSSGSRIIISSPVLEVDTDNHLVCLTKYSDDQSSPNLRTLKTRGSGNIGIGTTGLDAVKTCDNLLVVEARGYDGSSIQSTGKIKFSVDTFPGVGTSSGVNVCEGEMPTSLTLYTGCAAAEAERLKIDSCGYITFNNAFTFPITDGNANQVLQTDGAGELTWNDVTSLTSPNYYLTGGSLSTVVSQVAFPYLSAMSNTIELSGANGICDISINADEILRMALLNDTSIFSSILGITSWQSCCNVFDTHTKNLNTGIYGVPRGFCYKCNGATNYQHLSADDYLYLAMPLITAFETDGVSATIKHAANGWNIADFTVEMTHVTGGLFDNSTNCITFRCNNNVAFTVDIVGYDYDSLINKPEHDELTGFVANEHIDHTSVSLTGTKGIEGGGDISDSRTFCLSGQALCLHEATFSNSSLLAKNAAGSLTSVTTGAVADGSNSIPTSDGVFTFVASVSNQGNVNIDHSTVSLAGIGGIDNASLGDITTSRTVQLSGQARCLHDLTLNNGSLIAKDSDGNYVSVLSSTFMDDTNTVYDPWLLSASDTAGCFIVQSGCQVDLVGNEGIDICRSNGQVFFNLSDNAKQLHDLSLGVCKVIVTDNTNNITQVDNCVTVCLTGLSGDSFFTLGGTLNIGHDNTSNQASIASSSGTYINSVTLDDYGHVIGLTTDTETSYCQWTVGIGTEGDSNCYCVNCADCVFFSNGGSSGLMPTINTSDNDPTNDDTAYFIEFNSPNGEPFMTQQAGATGFNNRALFATTSAGVVSSSDLLVSDPANNRLGINVASPNEALTVSGNLSADGHATFKTLTIQNTGNACSEPLTISGDVDITGNVDVSEAYKMDGTDIINTNSEIVNLEYKGTAIADAYISSSGEWNNVYTSVNDTSANWDNVYTSVNSTSGEWDNVYTSVNSTSANWDNVYTSVNSTSSNWDNVYTSVNDTSANWDNVYTSVNSTSSNWDNVYTSVNTTSATWNTVSTKLPLAGGTITGNLTVNGNFLVEGTTTTINTTVTATSAMCIHNAGTGPALQLNQTGEYPIVDFQDDGNSAFYIENGGNVGMGTNNPNTELTVVGNISASTLLYDGNNNSSQWTDAYNDAITAIEVTGNTTKTITLTSRDGTTLSDTFTDNDTIYTHPAHTAITCNCSNGIVLQDISVDSCGHVTSVGACNLDDRYYTETESDSRYQIICSHSASNCACGWYTIATNTGDRAVARFGLKDTASGDHQSVVFYATHHFGNNSSNHIQVLTNSYYGTSKPFACLRIKEGGTYDGAALQVYVNGNTNSMTAYILGDNFQSSSWVVKDWVPDATDPGDVDNYSSFVARADINLDFAGQGQISTTGSMYSKGYMYAPRLYDSDNVSCYIDPADTSLVNTLCGSALYSGGNPVCTSETSHADVLVDGCFGSQGIMLRGSSAGSYSILTNNSSDWNNVYTSVNSTSANWDSAYTTVNTSSGDWDHSTAGYCTTDTTYSVTTVAVDTSNAKLRLRDCNNTDDDITITVAQNLTISATPASDKITITGPDLSGYALTANLGTAASYDCGDFAAAAHTHANATTTASGFVELATGAEVTTGTDTSRAITPSSLTSITKLGTIATGTWQGTAIADDYIASAADWNTCATSNHTHSTYLLNTTDTLTGNLTVTGNVSAAGLWDNGKRVCTAAYPTVGNGTITISAGTDLGTGGNFTVNQAGASTITIDHSDITRTDTSDSATATAGGTIDVIDSITSSARGHITAANVKTITLPSNADTVDNLHASSFLRSDTTTTYNAIGNDLNFLADGSRTLFNVQYCSGNLLTMWRFEQNNTGADINFERVNGSGNVKINDNRILTTADEGTGNGLHADCLDGQHGSYYARKACWPDVTTQLGCTVHSLTNLNTTGLWSKPAGYSTMVRAASSEGLPTDHGQSYFGYTITSRRDTGGGYSALLTAYDNSELWFTYQGSCTSYPTWRRIWHENNDGPNSGLNADLLDSQEGAYYLNYNNFTNTPTIPTDNSQLANSCNYCTTDTTYTVTTVAVDTSNAKLRLTDSSNTTDDITITVAQNLTISATPASDKITITGPDLSSYAQTANLGTAAFENCGTFALAGHTHTLANITDAGTAAAADTGDFAAASHSHTYATTGASGFVELATSAEVTAASSATRVITPSNLTSITKLGTIATGTWQGTAIADSYISSAANWNACATSSHTHTLANITDAGTAAACAVGDFALAGHNHSGVYDNYGDWDLLTECTHRANITSGTGVNFIGGTSISVTHGTASGNQDVTISHSDTSTLNGQQATTGQFVKTLTVDNRGHVTAVTFDTAGGSSPSYATTSASGVVELATSSEVTAGSSSTRVITPSSLTSITKLGTIATGTWQGTAIADSYIASAANWNNCVDGGQYGDICVYAWDSSCGMKASDHGYVLFCGATDISVCGCTNSFDNAVIAISYTGTSDYRQKYDIEPFDSGYDIVNNVDVYSYKLKDDCNNEVRNGMMAHELQEAGQCFGVYGTKDGMTEDNKPEYQKVEYPRLIPTLWSALKTAMCKIEDLETRLATLELQSNT